MREIDRANFVNNEYVHDIMNRLSILIKDPNNRVSFYLRLLNNAVAKMYVTVKDVGDYHVDRNFEFNMDLDQAKYLLDIIKMTDNFQDYIYYIEYLEDVCRVVQYEELLDGRKRVVRESTVEWKGDWFSDQIIVVQEPEITVDDEYIINRYYRFYASSKILTKEDSLLTTFIVEFNGESVPYYILPNARSAEISFDIFINPKYFLNEEELPLKVIAVDNEGHKSFTLVKLKINHGYVLTPSIIKPVVGEIIKSTGFLIEGSTFETSPITYAPKHIETEYRITSTYLGDEVLWSYTSSNEEELTSFFLDFNEQSLSLEWDKDYYIWIRYKEERLGWTEWSNYVIFKIQDDIEEDVEAPKVQGNAYVYVGHSYEYIITSYSITGQYIDHFTVTIGNESKILPSLPLNDESSIYYSIYNIDITPEMYETKNVVLEFRAIDNNGKVSFATQQYLYTSSLNSLGNDVFSVTQGESVTILNSNLLSNDTIDSVSPIKSIEYKNPVGGTLQPTENGVIFTSTGKAKHRAGFDYFVTNSFNITKSAHVDVIVNQLPDASAYVFATYEFTKWKKSYTGYPPVRNVFDYLENTKYVYNEVFNSWEQTSISLQDEFSYPRYINSIPTNKRYFITEKEIYLISGG